MVSEQRKTEERRGTGFSVLAARSRSLTLDLRTSLRNRTEMLATQAILVSFSVVFKFINSVYKLNRPQLKGLVSKKCPSVGRVQ